MAEIAAPELDIFSKYSTRDSIVGCGEDFSLTVGSDPGDRIGSDPGVTPSDFESLPEHGHNSRRFFDLRQPPTEDCLRELRLKFTPKLLQTRRFSARATNGRGLS